MTTHLRAYSEQQMEVLVEIRIIMNLQRVF
jgi:hypothetical protein